MNSKFDRIGTNEIGSADNVQRKRKAGNFFCFGKKMWKELTLKTYYGSDNGSDCDGSDNRMKEEGYKWHDEKKCWYFGADDSDFDELGPLAQLEFMRLNRFGWDPVNEFWYHWDTRLLEFIVRFHGKYPSWYWSGKKELTFDEAEDVVLLDELNILFGRTMKREKQEVIGEKCDAFEDKLRQIFPRGCIVSRRDKEDPEESRFAAILKRKEHVLLFVWHEYDVCDDLYDDFNEEFKGKAQKLFAEYKNIVHWERLGGGAVIVSIKEASKQPLVTYTGLWYSNECAELMRWFIKYINYLESLMPPCNHEALKKYCGGKVRIGQKIYYNTKEGTVLSAFFRETPGQKIPHIVLRVNGKYELYSGTDHCYMKRRLEEEPFINPLS